jgi:hypothetical protein
LDINIILKVSRETSQILAKKINRGNTSRSKTEESSKLMADKLVIMKSP